MTSARQPAGLAEGAVGGRWRSPSVGCPPLAGWSMYDDFTRPLRNAEVGDAHWGLTAIGGPSPVVSQQLPTADTEVGILRVETDPGASGYEGGTVGQPAGIDRSFGKVPPPGFIWRAKLRLEDTTEIEVFSGFIESHSRITGTLDFIGVRAVNAASSGTVNWFGVCRAGAVETTVDLGVVADGAWRIIGFEHLSGAPGTPPGSGGIQFFTEDASTGQRIFRTLAGTPVTSNLPTKGLTPLALAVITTAGVVKAADVDFWGAGGRQAR